MENEFIWADHINTLLEMQHKIFREDIFPDVKLVFRNGEYLLAHKTVLAITSGFFRNCLKDIPATSDAFITLIMPDIKKELMKKTLEFMYSGEVVIEANELGEFFDNKNFFDIKTPTINCVIQVEAGPKHIPSKPEKNTDFEEKTRQRQKSCSGNDDSEKETLNYNLSQPVESGAEESRDTYLFSFENSNFSEEDDTDCYTLKNPKCSEIEEIEIDQILHPESEDQQSDEDLESDDPIESTHLPLDVKKKERERKKHETFLKMEGAIKAVLNDGKSVSKIAKVYGVSKTLLWRRVKNNPNYKKPLLECRDKERVLRILREGLQNRKSLKQISEETNVPPSTLHFYKVVLLKSGQLPSSVNVVKRNLKTDVHLKRKLELAIAACKNGMTQNRAAIKFGCSKATLFRRMKAINENK